jgi:hypothetical protein
MKNIKSRVTMAVSIMAAMGACQSAGQAQQVVAVPRLVQFSGMVKEPA